MNNRDRTVVGKVPVSYTHLDVYKRQGHVHLRNIQNFLLLEELLYRIVRKRNADKDDREKEGESDRKDRFRTVANRFHILRPLSRI